MSGSWDFPGDLRVLASDPTLRHEPCTTIHDMTDARITVGFTDMRYTVSGLEPVTPALGGRRAFLVSDPKVGHLASMAAKMRADAATVPWFTVLGDALAHTGVETDAYEETVELLRPVRPSGD